MEKGLSRVARIARFVARPWRYLRDLGPATLSRHANRWRNDREYSVTVRGIRTSVWLRANQPDYRILRHTVGRRDVDIALKNPPTFIIDAGANIGCSSLWFANRWPNARILAIEPDEDNCRMFRLNCGEYPNITLLAGAVWSRRGPLRICNPDYESCGFQVTEQNIELSAAPVRGYTIAELMLIAGAERISLLKVDIEGAELELFTHSEHWLRRVDNMLVETHDRFRPGCAATVSRAVANLPATHYRQGELDVYHFRQSTANGRALRASRSAA